MTALGEAAIALAAKGMRVFPCIERSKEPAVSGGFKRATTDQNIVAGWWRTREFNIGIATGAGSGLWVVDIDGDDGEQTMRKLESAYGTLPPTIEAITGRGRHLYFRWSTGDEVRNTQDNPVMPGIDVRGEGGYVLAPPSIHPSGCAYAWSVDSADGFADAPDWLITLVTSRVYPAGASFYTVNESEKWRSFVGEMHEGSHRGHAIARLYGSWCAASLIRLSLSTSRACSTRCTASRRSTIPMSCASPTPLLTARPTVVRLGDAKGGPARRWDQSPN